MEQIFDVREWLRLAVSEDASDVFIGVGRRISFKVNGVIVPKGVNPLISMEAEKMIISLYELARRPMDNFNQIGDDDFPLTVPGLARFRVSAYRQRSSMAAVIRVIMFDIPDYKTLNIPSEVMKIASLSHGLVLVTGPAGSGKTTTLACIIDAINKSKNGHIVTLEDPIEFLHRDNKSLISQREISSDTQSYISALRACLRQAPDIILLGEMRDHETIKTAMTAAETGHLVLSTLHTVGAVNTVDRIVDVFPPNQQQQIRVQISMLLQTVVTQQLLPNMRGKLIPAFEIMHVNSAIRTLIRESKTHQIDGIIQTSSSDGMVGMDQYIASLYRHGEISFETAVRFAANSEQLARRLKGLPQEGN